MTWGAEVAPRMLMACAVSGFTGARRLPASTSYVKVVWVVEPEGGSRRKTLPSDQLTAPPPIASHVVVAV